MMKFLTFAIIAMQAAFLNGEIINVTITCSNGAIIPNLPIQVKDSRGLILSDITKSDASGQFIIENTDSYTPPYSLSFKTSKGITCGNYPIVVPRDNRGFVRLNYYPTELPCSCSKLVR